MSYPSRGRGYHHNSSRNEDNSRRRGREDEDEDDYSKRQRRDHRDNRDDRRGSRYSESSRDYSSDEYNGRSGGSGNRDRDRTPESRHRYQDDSYRSHREDSRGGRSYGRRDNDNDNGRVDRNSEREPRNDDRVSRHRDRDSSRNEGYNRGNGNNHSRGRRPEGRNDSRSQNNGSNPNQNSGHWGHQQGRSPPTNGSHGQNSNVGNSTSDGQEDYDTKRRNRIENLKNRVPFSEEEKLAYRTKMAEERDKLRKAVDENEIRNFDHVQTRPEIVRHSSDLRPEKIGAPISLLANFFKVKTRENQWTLYNYCVSFEPEQEKTHDKKILLRAHDKALRAYVFDGSNLYSPHRNLDAEFVSSLKVNNIPQEVNIRVRQVGIIEPENIQYLQIYGIIVRTALRTMGLEELGRHFFDRSDAKKLQAWNLEIWPGFAVALRNYDGGLLVNVDYRSRVLRRESCLDVIKSCSYDKDRVRRELIPSSVITRYNRKTYRISDISWEQNPLSTFTYGRGENKREISFREYYAEKYPGFEITNENQPLLVSRPTKKDRHRGMVQDILLIPELCNVTGLSEEQRKNFKLMRDIHQATGTGPGDRHRQISGFMKRLSQNPEAAHKLKEWCIKVEKDMLEVPGRRLVAEELVMRNSRNDAADSFMVEHNADWTNNFRGRMRMYTSVELRKWVIIVGAENRRNVDRLLETLKFVSRGLDFRFNPDPEIVTCYDSKQDPKSYVKAINDAIAKNRDYQMVFVILSTDSADAYSAIKERCNINFGVPSQCFKTMHLADNKKGALASICTKVVIQMNAKLGGEPWICKNPFPDHKTMVVGFDVHHSGKGKGKISIGAMVATTNNTFSKFYSTFSVHSSSEHLSQNMCQDFTKCLMAFHKKNEALPDRVFFYRDGVGEGDLEYVHNTEVSQILESASGIYADAGKTLKFNYIIVTKKGNARLMRQGHEIINPEPGTCVDDVITMPQRFDFFLVSQQSRKGQTVSPTAYNVLRVDDELTAEEIQMTTHKFCHLYYNWTGTVSVPFVCQYAHKLSYLTGTTYRGEVPVNDNLAHKLYYL